MASATSSRRAQRGEAQALAADSRLYSRPKEARETSATLKTMMKSREEELQNKSGSTGGGVSEMLRESGLELEQEKPV